MGSTKRVKRLVILGSTGSIGRQTLDILRGQRRFRVVGLAAGDNLPLLAEQVREFRPLMVSCKGESHLDPEPGHPVEYVPMEEMVVSSEADLIVVGTVGAAGLFPTLAALKAGKPVALANKEVLVMAGALVKETAARYGGSLLPVDSEHSAIWQCLLGEAEASQASVKRLILTASGGAFRDRSLEELAQVTPEEALRHPTWSMGPKITVDSATLMNKGFEVIEAHWLFDCPWDKIEVVLHRESIVHSLVEFIDGTLKAQLSLPDMRLPIQYALTYPERWPSPAPAMDFSIASRLTFEPLDETRYPCLSLAREAGRAGGTCTAVLNAADEVAVASFLAGRISFLDIYPAVADTLEHHQPIYRPCLEELLEADRWARDYLTAKLRN
ncbi:MAG TPA: 1-deoxy-D-xylulose-5-phosphate reductoisomerase [Dehalococcoidia bacterium]|nr:1-deoxy-D-xylulose-5-phosphate reductoisomerase [Dehalococcoidia bacterium]